MYEIEGQTSRSRFERNDKSFNRLFCTPMNKNKNKTKIQNLERCPRYTPLVCGQSHRELTP